MGRKKSIKKINGKKINRKSAKRNKKMAKKTRVKKRKKRVKVGGNPPAGIPKPDVAAGLYTQEFKGPWGNTNITPTTTEYVNKNLVSANPPPGATTQYPGTIRQGNNYDTYVGVNDYVGTSKNSGAFKIKCTSKAGGKRKKSLKRRKKRIQKGRGGNECDKYSLPLCPIINEKLETKTNDDKKKKHKQSQYDKKNNVTLMAGGDINRDNKNCEGKYKCNICTLEFYYSTKTGFYRGIPLVKKIS